MTPKFGGVVVRGQGVTGRGPALWGDVCLFRPA